MGRPHIHFNGAALDALAKSKTQAQRIVARFGGAARLRWFLGRVGHRIAVQTIYRWTYPDHSGLIPARQVGPIVRAAALAGIVLTDQDWTPLTARQNKRRRNQGSV